MMNAITRWPARAAIGLAVGAIAVTLASPALASHVLVDAEAQGAVVVGERANLSVTLQAATGARLPRTTVVLYQHASFAGVDGEMEVGRAVTDENGVASIAYRPRLAGHHELRLEYVSPEGGTVEAVTTAIDASGGRQLVHSPAGVDVPGVGGGLVLAVLTVVWSILLSVALRLVAIARAAGRAEMLELTPVMPVP